MSVCSVGVCVRWHGKREAKEENSNAKKGEEQISNKIALHKIMPVALLVGAI